MFHHAFSASIPKDTGRPFSYWVIHGPTLTPIRVNVGPGGRVTFHLVPHPPGETAVISPPPPSTAPNLDALFAEIQAANPRLTYKGLLVLTREQAPVPEYLIAFDIDGTHPAIVRTQEPQFVNYINERDEMLSAESAYSRTTNPDLSAYGWCYWWQDAQAAYENLAPAIIAAAE